MAPRSDQIWLIHGQNIPAINAARDRVLGRLLPPEFRNENLTEYITTSGKALRLEDIGYDVVSELSTMSLFGDGARRVVIITDLKDLCEAPRLRAADGAAASRKSRGKGKGKPQGAATRAEAAEKFCAFLTGALLQTPNAIIFLNYERDYATTVDKHSPVYLAVAQAGRIEEHRGEIKMFALEDALRERNAPRAIQCLRDLNQSGSANMIFGALVRVTRSLLQAKVVALRGRSASELALLKELFPKDRTGFFSQHPNVQKKSANGARNFSASELIGALKELRDINRLVIPVSTDVYVRDLSLAIELWVLKWFSRPSDRLRGAADWLQAGNAEGWS